MLKVRKDLTGMIFGRLTVIKQMEDHIYPSGQRRAVWLCECGCEEHNQIIVLANSLTTGNTQSCGCLAREMSSKAHLEDLTGQTFGRLKVIRRVEDYIYDSGDRGVRWLCECSCNDHNQVVVLANNLRNGNTQSCGCLQKECQRAVKKKNTFDLSGEYGILWTTNTNTAVYFDLEQADKILQYAWHEDNCGYPVGRVDGKDVRMHALLGCKGYDHINRNKMDNRISNLRPCTTQQNLCNKPKSDKNTSGVIGVSWHDIANKWYARISVNKKQLYLGVFINKDDAIRARLQAEQKYFGEFAPQQHLYEQYGITPQND